MKDNQLFETLFQLYLAGKATPEQQQQLMELVEADAHDAFLQEQVDAMLQQATWDAAMDEQRARAMQLLIVKQGSQVSQLYPVKKSWWPRFAMVAALMGVLAVGVWFWQLAPKSKTDMAGTTKPVLQPAADSKGKKYIRFSDGSTALLNEGSQIHYPDVFTGATREVSLTGEAYFDIKHSSDKPFVVRTGTVSTTVLGTAFNIKAYEKQPVVVTVTRGKVRVADNKTIYAVLTANQQVAVHTDTRQAEQTQVSAEKVLLWKKQYLVLNDISMEEAAALIGAKYNVHIVFTDNELKQERISATFLNNESLEQVLTVVTGVINASYSIQPNDQVIISSNNK